MAELKGPLPRAGTGQEIYLIPTVTVEPHLVVSDDGSNGEYGLEPGFPEPDENNINNDVRLDVLGSVEDSVATENRLPITVAVEGIAVFRKSKQAVLSALNQALYGSSGPSGNVAVGAAVRAMGQTEDGTTGTPVPRFSVRETGGNKQGIDTDFVQFPIGDPTEVGPDPNFGPVSFASPAFVIDRNGVLFMFHLEGPYDQNPVMSCKVFAHSYNQASDTDWQEEIGDADVNPVEVDLGYEPFMYLRDPQIAAVLFQDDIYVLISDAGFSGAETDGKVYTYVYQPNETIKLRILNTTGVQAIGGLAIINSIAAVAIADRVVVAIGSVTSIGLPEPLWTIQIGWTSDMVTWATQDDNAFYAMDGFVNVMAKVENTFSTTSSKVITAMSFADENTGWAVSHAGAIYKTENGGSSWHEQDSPIENLLALRDVKAYDADIAWAVGEKSCILKTIDGGITWLIESLSVDIYKSLDGSKFVNAAERRRTGIEEAGLYALAIAPTDSNVVWVVGNDSFLAYTTVGGNANWIHVPRGSGWFDGSYTDIVVVKNSGTLEAPIWQILISGWEQMSTITNGRYTSRFVRIDNATAGKDLIFSPEDYYGDWDKNPIKAMFRSEYENSGTKVEIWAVGHMGKLLRRSDSGVWSEKSSKTVRNLTCIFVDHDAGEVAIGTEDGRILRSTNLGTTWLTQRVGTETTVSDVASFDASSVMIVSGGAGVWFSQAGGEQRTYPALVQTYGGGVLMAAANMQRGKIEFFRSTDGGATFTLVEHYTDNLTFPPQETFGGPSTATLQPSLTVADDGVIICTAGCDALVSSDRFGMEWYRRDDPRLNLPLGWLYQNGEFPEKNINATRSTIAYGGGRIFSAVVSFAGGIGTFVARAWSENSVNYMPIVPGVPQWLGIGDLRCLWSGLSVPLGDNWTISAAYRFAKDKLAIESPSIYYRNDDDDNGVTLYWDRQATEIAAALGSSWGWNATAFALFGTNFREAKIALSGPAYGSATFPTSPNDFIEFTLRSDIDEGVVSADVNYTSGSATNVIRCTGKNWIPGQFATNGLRRYFVHVPDADRTYEIADNTRDELILIGRASVSPSIGAGYPFVIYTDRMFCDGSGGTINQTLGPDSLLDSPYQHFRWLRLTIPAQTVPVGDGFFRIGTPIFGRHIPITVKRPQGSVDRDRFGPIRWQPVPHTLEQLGITGVGSVEHFGRTGQRWVLGYEGMYWWDRDHTLAPLLPQMRRAFALVFDNDDPTGTLELVRLSSDVPEVTNRAGDLWDASIVLDEVL